MTSSGLFRPRGRWELARGLALAVVAPGAATAIGLAADFEDRPGAIGLYIVAVGAATYLGGVWAGIMSTVVSFFALDYWFVGSERGLSPAGGQEIFALVVFGVAVLGLGWALQRERRSSRALRLERRLEHVLEATDTGSWEWDVPLNVVRWSRNLGPMHGLAPGEQPADYRAYLELIHPDDRPRIEAAVDRALSAGEGYDIELRVVHGDGEIRWLAAQASVVEVERGQPAALIGLTRDITDRKRREDRQRFFARASETLTGSLDYEQTLSEVARLAVPAVADWCTVDLIGLDGALSSVAVAHVDPLKVGLVKEMRERYAPDPEAPSGLAAVVRSGNAELYRDIPDELLAEGAQSEEHLELARSLGLRSAMIVPLRAGREVIGAITFVVSETPRVYGDDDLELAEELARRAAVAVENARLHRAQEEARELAEAGRRQMERLQILTAQLSAAVTPAEIAAILVRQGSESFGAAAGWVSVLSPDGAVFENVASFGYGADFVERYRRIPVDAPLVVAEVGRSGEARWLERTMDEPHRELHEAEDTTGAESLAVVPLASVEGPLGFFALRFAGPRDFQDDEQALLLTFARQSSDAFRRAQLFEQEQRTRRELRRVQEITATLSAAPDIASVGAAVLDSGLKVMGARAAVVMLLGDTGLLEVVGQRGYDGVDLPDAVPADSPFPVGRAVRTGEIVVIPTLAERREAYELAEDVREASGPGMVAAVPFMLTGRPLGALVVTLEEERDLTEAERSFLYSLSQQAALALERARLFELERESREDLEGLQNVTAALAAAATVQDIAAAVVEQGMVAMRAKTGVFGRVEDGGLTILRRRGYEDARFPDGLLLDDSWPLSHAVEKGELVVLGDVEERRRAYHAPDVRPAAEKGVLVAVPVRVGEEMVAGFGYTLERPGALLDRERRFLESLAALAAQAFDRAGLYQREREARREAERAAQTLRALQAISEVGLAARTLDDLLDVLLVVLRDALGGDRAAVLLRSEERGDLFMRAAVGLDEDVRANVRIPWGRGIAGSIAASGAPRIVEDVVAAHPFSQYLRAAGGSLVGAPLRVSERTIGVLHVGSDELDHFGPDHLALLEVAADRVALAVERTMLFEREHEVAVTLQRSVLPERLPELPRVEVAARYIPGASGLEVGGDWYDLLELGDDIVGLAVGDVVGKGVAAAATMTQLRNALRVYALEGLKPSSVLARLNRLVELSGPSFATLAFATLDLRSLTCRYASAGHPPPVLLRADGRASLLEGGRSVPLGVHEAPPYRQDVVRLRPGDTLLLYTDGLVERRGVALDDSLERLVASVARHAGDVEPMLEAVLADLNAAEASDDVACLAFRPLAASLDRIELRFPSAPESLAPLRRELRGWLAGIGANDLEVHELVLACSEAAANAVEHAQEPGRDEFVVLGETSDHEVRIVVRDYGRWIDREPRADRGFGLHLIREMMDDVQVEPADDGTEVRIRRRLRAPVMTD